MATAKFSKFADILSAALSQHHLSGFEIAQLEFHHFKIQLFLTNSTLSKLSNLLSELSARVFKWFPQGLFTYFTFFLEMIFPQFAYSSIPNCLQVFVLTSLFGMTICHNHIEISNLFSIILYSTTLPYDHHSAYYYHSIKLYIYWFIVCFLQ